MAQESCNLDKEEAEVLKPSSPPPSNPLPSQPATNTTPSNPPSALSSSSIPVSVCLKRPQELSAREPERLESSAEVSGIEDAEKQSSQTPVQFGNRCSSCRKRVGLTGFRCRCGDLFCPRHRYSETHDCSFDYKALGREEISKANPVIRAAKIIKI